MNEIKWDSTRTISPTNKNVHYNSGVLRLAEIGRPLSGYVLNSSDLDPGINYFENNGFIFGQTAEINVQPIPLFEENEPQPGITEFASELGIEQNQLVMPRLDKHTNKVLLVNGLDDLLYEQSEGRSVGFDSKENDTYFDSLIIQESEHTKEIVLAITGADCPSVVGKAVLDTGNRVIFGIHAGRKGCLSGIIEKTADKLNIMGVLPGTIQLAVGPGGQALELPLKTIKQEAELNEFSETKDLWALSTITKYSMLSNKQEVVVYDNQADVIRRTILSFGDLLSPNGLSIIDANTVTTDGLKSYRAMTIASKIEDESLKNQKIGRNALFTRFY